MRVSTTVAPSASSRVLAAWATARLTTFSCVPAGPTAPVSPPPCPGSSTTVAPVIGVPATVTSFPHGEVATNDPSPAARRTASTIPLGVTTAPGPVVGTAGHGTGAVVVVEATVVVVEVDDDVVEVVLGGALSSEDEHATASSAAQSAAVMRERRSLYSPFTTSTMRVPASVGFWPTFTPAACSASCLAAAVPLPPDTMAPAWPIFLPGGAVTPAM